MHLVPLLLEGEDQDALDVQVVIDDEDLRGSHARTLRRWYVRPDYIGGQARCCQAPIIRAPPSRCARGSPRTRRRIPPQRRRAPRCEQHRPRPTAPSARPPPRTADTPGVQPISRSSFGAMSRSAAGRSARLLDRVLQHSPRPNRGCRHHQPRPETGERIAYLPHAVGDRMLKLGVRGIGHHRGHRQVGAAVIATEPPMLIPIRAIGPSPRSRGSATAAATSRCSSVPSVTRARAALAVAAKVELEDVEARLDPRHELGQLRQAVPLKPCSRITAVRVSRPAGSASHSG